MCTTLASLLSETNRNEIRVTQQTDANVIQVTQQTDRIKSELRNRSLRFAFIHMSLASVNSERVSNGQTKLWKLERRRRLPLTFLDQNIPRDKRVMASPGAAHWIIFRRRLEERLVM